MPINDIFLEPGIAYSQWHGDVTAADILSAQEYINGVLSQYNVPQYVTLIDFTRCQNVVLDIRLFTTLAVRFKGKRIGLIAIKPTLSVIGLMKMIASLTRYPIRVVNTYDEGIIAAQEMLETEKVK